MVCPKENRKGAWGKTFIEKRRPFRIVDSTLRLLRSYSEDHGKTGGKLQYPCKIALNYHV